MNKDEDLHALYILESIEDIYVFIEDMQILFFEDKKTYAAVLRKLQTLSESASKIKSEIRAMHPEIPWHNINGFRNILA